VSPSSREDVPLPRGSAFSGGAIALWLLVALFIAGHIYLNVLTLKDTAFTDFHVYHEALGRAARGETVYDLNSPMPFLYPPFFLIMLWPMGWLNEPTAAMVWLHLQNLFLLVSLLALLTSFRPFKFSLLAWTIILFTGFSPVMLNNLYGQTNLLYLVILSVFILAYLRSGRTGILPVTGSVGFQPAIRHGQDAHATVWEVVAALTLSLAISIRILPIALLVFAGIQRRNRIVLWTVGFVLAEALAAGALVGFATEWRYFTSSMFHLHGLENMREISLLALAQRLIPFPGLAALMFTVLLAAGLGMFFVWVCGPMRRLLPSVALHIAFVIASMVLFAPLLEYHHYTILLAPYTLILGDLTRRSQLRLTSALPVFLSWAIVGGANQLSHYQFGAVAFVALAGAALVWAYSISLITGHASTPAS